MLSNADLLDWTKADAADTATLRRLEQAAVRYCERVTGRYLGATATIIDTIRWRGWPLALANEPIGGVITTLEQWDGSVWETADAANYYLDGSFIWPNVFWRPTGSPRFQATYEAGYTVDAGDANVWAAPEDVQQAVRLLVGHWTENREAVVTGTIAIEVKLGVDALLSSHSRVAV